MHGAKYNIYKVKVKLPLLLF